MSLHSGSNFDFDALLYGQPHPGTLQYLQQSLSNAITGASEASQKFFQGAFNVYDQFYSSDALRKLRATVDKIGALFDPNTIRYLESLKEMRTAQSMMRQYIMADPWIRNEWYQQRIEGYDGYYGDNAVGLIGDAHEDYMRVMDGVIQVDDKTQDTKYTLYYGYDTENINKLDLDQQVSIINTWDRIKERIKLGKEDPTSVYGSLL